MHMAGDGSLGFCSAYRKPQRTAAAAMWPKLFENKVKLTKL
jgi:hypothetical protein